MDVDGLAVEHGPERAVNGVRRRLADTSAAAERLGFRAEIGLEAGLRDLVGWWRAEQALIEDPAAESAVAAR
jgi:UDP-glucose 4-epimerase